MQMKNSDNFLIYTASKNIVIVESDLINNRILQMILLLVMLTCVILIYLLRRLSEPIRGVVRQIKTPRMRLKQFISQSIFFFNGHITR